jgi:KaiC/GvpD/RAD55 family RecA-like ATPase
MVKSELVKRSPLRILENSIRGSLSAGSIGAIASRKGVGKTACLVHLATDKLFQGKHVIHVSFAGRTDHIISWYEDIFKEIARKRQLENAMTVHDELIKNRVVMNFSQQGVSPNQVFRSIRAMISEGHFAADMVIFDGYNFDEGSVEDFRKIKSYANELGLAVWFSVSLPDDATDEQGVPMILGDYLVETDVVITLTPTERFVKLNLVKDYAHYPQEDLHLKLDPKTLLIAEEDE